MPPLPVLFVFIESGNHTKTVAFLTPSRTAEAAHMKESVGPIENVPERRVQWVRAGIESYSEKDIACLP